MRARGDAATRGDRRGILRRLGVILAGLVSPPSRRGSTASDASLPLRRDRDIVGVVVHPGGAARADEAFDEVKRERTGHGAEAHQRANRRGKRRDGSRPSYTSRVRRRRRGVRVRELVKEGVAEERADGEGGECADDAAGKEPGAAPAPEDEGRTRGIRHTATRDAQETPTVAPIAIAYSRRRPNDSTSNRGER